MSSIYGFFDRQNKHIDPNVLKKMQAKLSYWKADRTGSWCHKSIGLGQIMLCSTPESLTEKLPFTVAHFTIIANARIDNREELYRGLSIEGPLSKVTDSYLILKAYQKWKEDCPKYLTGEFAFAIWDEKEQILFCAKDAIGIRPFYYSFTDNHFIFSSEIGGILASGFVKEELNDKMLAIHLIGFKGEKKETSFKNVNILLPAHWLKVGPEKLQIERYWDVDLKKNLNLKNNNEYEEAFRFYMKQAVARRTRSAFPIASFLSGGLDSTSITGIALKEKMNTTPFYMYSWAHAKGEEKNGEDDRAYIDLFLKFHKHEVFNHKYLNGLAGYFTLLPKFQRFYDEPFRDLEHYTRFQSYEHAQNDGVRTILSGVGGDELTSSFGYEHIVGLFLQLRWGKGAYELHQIKKNREYTYKKTVKKELIKPLRSLYKKEEAWGRGAIDAGRNYLRNKRNNFYINPELMKDLGFEQLIEGHLDESILSNPLFNPVRQRHYLNLHDGHLDISFNQRYQASLGYGMQYTYPLLDKDLIEFCMSIPSDQFHQNGQGRSLIRRGMKTYVPKEILKRNTKYATSPNMLKRIRSEGDWMREMIEIGERSSFIAKYIDLKSLKNDFNAFMKGEDSIHADFIRTFYMIFFLSKYK
jgi:asparagine synthase (glutamine-hydrolysing)